jgi:glycosyltransferase involved in cell wall biosynthesis
MRVCIVAENHARVAMGGAEYQTELLTDELASRPNVQLTYLARRVPTGASAQGIDYALRQIGHDRGIRRRAVLFDARELHRALADIRPDVIYQQCRQSYTAVCAHYARKAGIPFFFHVASDSDLNWRWVTMHLSPNTPFDIAECMSGMWGIRRASHIIAQTGRQRDMLRDNVGRDTDILVRNFQPVPEGLPDKPAGPLQILFVANFKTVKRPWLFMDLAESFAGRSDLQFTMIGRPTQEARFAQMMERTTRIPNLRYLGELPIDEVNARMAEAAIHVNTSSFEGFPNTFLQAWARGAIVATLNVDPDGCLSQEGLGFCANESMQRLHGYIDEISRSPERRVEIQQRAFSYVQENHGMKQCRRLADMILDAASLRANGKAT